MRVCQNSFFEEIAPATVICRRGETFCLGIMTHSLITNIGLTLWITLLNHRKFPMGLFSSFGKGSVNRCCHCKFRHNGSLDGTWIVPCQHKMLHSWQTQPYFRLRKNRKIWVKEIHRPLSMTGAFLCIGISSYNQYKQLYNHQYLSIPVPNHCAIHLLTCKVYY